MIIKIMIFEGALCKILEYPEFQDFDDILEKWSTRKFGDARSFVFSRYLEKQDVGKFGGAPKFWVS